MKNTEAKVQNSKSERLRRRKGSASDYCDHRSTAVSALAHNESRVFGVGAGLFHRACNDAHAVHVLQSPIRPRWCLFGLCLLLATGITSISVCDAQVNMFTYEGRVTVNGMNFTGTGQFKFALVAPNGAGQVWRNDGLPGDGEPTVSVAVPVEDGLFTVLLGDSSAPGMAPLPDGIFATYPQLKLRAWFNDGTNGYAQLVPDTLLTPTPYALVAARALSVPMGSIGAAQIAPGSIPGDRLAPGAAAQNLATSGLNLVPPGGVVLSERKVDPEFLDAGYVPYGGKVVINEDAWTNLPPGPPATGSLNSGRHGHKAGWGGSWMFVVGGTPDSTPLIYNPAGNSWTEVSQSNAPAIGEAVQAFWDSQHGEFLVWDAYHRSGGRYDPASDSWTPMSSANAPSARVNESAAFLSGMLVVWGGSAAADYTQTLNTGARYNAATDTWTPTSTVGAPQARAAASATPVGSQILIFGGAYWTITSYPPLGNFPGFQELATGARYNPTTDTWSPIANAPEGRYAHTATWTGSQLFIWGGEASTLICSLFGGPCAVGAAPRLYGLSYSPAADSWSKLNTNGAPPAYLGHSAIWDGSRYIVWGGSFIGGFALDRPFDSKTNSGASYNPTTSSWSPLPASPLTSRDGHSAVWTGTEMIVWGGTEDSYRDADDGARYRPGNNSWVSMTSAPSSGDPTERVDAATIWAGDRLLVWGGRSGFRALRSGGIYQPGAGWTNMPDIGTPSARSGPAAVWTGTEMIVWGGLGALANVPLNTGGRFNMESNRWIAISTENAPLARGFPSAVWTGDEMIVYGGFYLTNLLARIYVNGGGRYNAQTDTWTPLPEGGSSPGARAGHTAVWTGDEMIIWGGATDFFGYTLYLNSGCAYNPSNNTWRVLASEGAPSLRSGHSAVWTGKEMLIWGGYGPAGALQDGARYDPVSDSWSPISTTNAPIARYGHSAVWTGQYMLIAGGNNGSGFINAGAMYDPLADEWLSMLNGSPGGRTGQGAVWTGKELMILDGQGKSAYVGDNGLLGEQDGDNRAFTPRRVLYYYQKH